MVNIIDCTLREGAQAPNVVWTIEQSLAIARGLEDFGVHCIEAGHPNAGDLEFERTRSVSRILSRVPLLAHARARIEDVSRVRDAGATWVGIFAGVNWNSRAHKFNGRSLEEILEMVQTSVTYAKSIGLKVRFTLEDSSRTEWELQRLTYRTAIAAGADRVCFSDTVGVLTPQEARISVERLRSMSRETPIEVHFHNDRGLALANALEASLMADWISSSVNGVGERCGITDTIALGANIDFNRDGTMSDERVRLSRKLSDMVSAFGRNTVLDRQPVVGRHAFTHCADLHIKAFEKDLNAYCWLQDFPGQEAHRNTPVPLSAYVNHSPRLIPAAESKAQRTGWGDHYVMLNDRVAPNLRQYCIVSDIGEPVEMAASCERTHTCDSLLILLGAETGKTGLQVSVRLGDEDHLLNSPASVFIPSGVSYSYSILKGKGTLVNHVLAKDFDHSLMDIDWLTSAKDYKSSQTPIMPANSAPDMAERSKFVGQAERV